MNRLLFRLQYYVLQVLRYVFCFAAGGTECVVCGEACLVLPVCADCRKKYFTAGPAGSGVCRICGKTLISENELCMSCRKAVLLKHLDGVYPVSSYRLWNKGILCRWKLDGERIFSGFLAEVINARLCQVEELKGSFVVVPVPPRPGKIRKEGWDQIEELACFLEAFYHRDVRRILVRHTDVEQKTLCRSQRMDVIGKAYSLNAAVRNVPETVCLIDDVLTTGSTIEACAEVLKNAGCRNVFAVTLFSVDG